MLRRLQRAVVLAWALMGCFIRLPIYRLGGPLTPRRRALWLQDCCRAVLSSMGVRYRVVFRNGDMTPTRGMVVSNHLSYIDILIYSAVMPCVFVAKSEINSWPAFGSLARSAQSIFVDRTSLKSAAVAAQEITRRLVSDNVPVLVFPEGTSTDGSAILPFHSPLFQPAIKTGSPITTAAVRYFPGEGESEANLCWYGDQSLLPHIWKVLAARSFVAEIRFDNADVYEDRKIAALETHRRAVALRE